MLPCPSCRPRRTSTVSRATMPAEFYRRTDVRYDCEMPRQFGLVDDKLYEADFFLDRLAETGVMYEARYYFSAFATAARSVTFVLQACLSDVPGFAEWYERKRDELRRDPISRFFHRFRTESQKIGTNPLRMGTLSREAAAFHLHGVDVPETNATVLAQRYMRAVVALIHECYDVFGTTVDPDQYHTLRNLRRLGRSIEDIEEELGFPRGWTKIDGASDGDRLYGLRSQIPMSGIDPLFIKYLGKPRAFATE